MRCIHCEETFDQYEFNNKYCKEIDCQTAKAMALLNKKKASDKKKREKMTATQTQDFKAMKIRVEAPKRKGDLQKEINKLARQIDYYFSFNCIDCGKQMLKQVHGAHFHNVGGNENIRYNLHNIHSATSQCNKFSSEHKVGYREGIILRYGDDYLEFIDTEIPKTYKYIGLNETEVIEKLAIVRKLNRDFNTFSFTDGFAAREMMNKLIGIYV